MDRDLVERAMSGDHDAFSQLARVAAGRLLVIARLILHDEPAAEDATQEALVSAWRHIRGLRDPERFEAWLHRLLVNECHRAGGRSVPASREVHIPTSSVGTRRTGRIVDRDQLDAASASSTSTIGRSSSSPTTWGSGPKRPPRSSAGRPAPYGRASIAQSSRCAPRSRRTPGPMHREGRTDEASSVHRRGVRRAHRDLARERAHGPAADQVLDQAVAQRPTRPLPGWLAPERWLPRPLAPRLRQGRDWCPSCS